MKTEDKLLIRTLRGENLERPPIWLMRQAGRYLPEYRATRKEAGSFLDLCFNPDLAIEVTLQPIRRFAFDASIVFSDILVLPLALGQKVWFEEGQGPRLEALDDGKDLDRLSLERTDELLDPIYQILRGLRRELPAQTSLIGFAGAPWTIASYMIEGGTSRDFIKSRSWAYRNDASFQRLIDLLVEATSRYLVKQVENGAEVIQIFDSWAGVWPDDQFERWCLKPVAEIIRRIKSRHPDTPIIHFPRGAGLLYQRVAEECGADGLSIDTTVPLSWVRDELQEKIVPQGNLDPVALLAGGSQLADRVSHILEILGDGPFVLNLGHGILPNTPISHVEEVIDLVRS